MPRSSNPCSLNYLHLTCSKWSVDYIFSSHIFQPGFTGAESSASPLVSWTVLNCPELFWTVLNFTVYGQWVGWFIQKGMEISNNQVLNLNELYCTLWSSTALFCSLLHCSAPHGTALQYTLLYCSVMRRPFNVLYCKHTVQCTAPQSSQDCLRWTVWWITSSFNRFVLTQGMAGRHSTICRSGCCKDVETHIFSRPRRSQWLLYKHLCH